MNHAVVKFCQFGAVPAVGGAYEVARDALQLVDFVAAALRACVEVVGGVFISAVHTAVAVVADRSLADVVLVDEVDDVGDSLWVVSCVAVDFHIEYVSAASELVVGSLHFSLVARAALVPYRHVV